MNDWRAKLRVKYGLTKPKRRRALGRDLGTLMPAAESTLCDGCGGPGATWEGMDGKRLCVKCAAPEFGLAGRPADLCHQSARLTPADPEA